LPNIQYFLEVQANSGRWRALTRAHTRPSAKTWKKELYQKIHSILVIASWDVRSSENEESYGNRLPSIFEAINELRTAIGEEFTSADLEIFTFECGMTYDPENMEYAWYVNGDGRQFSGKRPPGPEAIVGTTGIGLAKRNAKDTLQAKILIPAKIVLRSTMDEALGPIVQNTDGANLDGRD
jgi:hypothetical protein